MTLESSILNNLKKLPKATQQAVFLYTEFLVNRTNQQDSSQLESAPAAAANKRGGLGIWKDKIWIADDFDAPLDEFQEYM